MTTTSAAIVAAVTEAFRVYWHDCWCPDFFLHAGFHVDYCPTHGFPWRTQDEFGQPLSHCGCQDCHRNLDSLVTEFADGTTHHRKSGFIPPNGRIPVLAVRTSLAASVAAAA
jgi:hypothetical protein